jgi:hypothetical protein
VDTGLGDALRLPQRGGSLNHCVRSQFSFAEQMRFILAKLVGADLIRWTFKIRSKSSTVLT